MSIFEKNTNEAYELFKSVFPTYDSRKLFLLDLQNSNFESDNLETENKNKIKKAVDLLVQNARDNNNRKLQQENFGPILATIRQNPEEIVKEIKNSEKFFIQFLQLTVIFLLFKEIENEKHNHDYIREALLKTLKGVIPLL